MCANWVFGLSLKYVPLFFQMLLRNVYFANIITVRPDATLRTDHRDQLYYVLRPLQLNRKKFYSLDKGQEFVCRVLTGSSCSLK